MANRCGTTSIAMTWWSSCGGLLCPRASAKSIISAQDREGLFAHVKKSGIETLISWGCKGVHQFLALGLNHFNLPRTEEMFKKVLMLPMHCELTDDQVRYTSEAIKNFYR
jgi:dTDP-4-amino-4,6-dideoxygalactose transaminase